MLSVAIEPFMLSVVMLNDVAPIFPYILRFPALKKCSDIQYNNTQHNEVNCGAQHKHRLSHFLLC